MKKIMKITYIAENGESFNTPEEALREDVRHVLTTFKDDAGDSLVHCWREDVGWELSAEKIANFIKAFGFNREDFE